MKTNQKNRPPTTKFPAHTKPLWFLVLVPHRDTRLVLRKWSACLFKESRFCGAYSFPWVAPLALLSRPFSAMELQGCARAIREETMRVNGGKISAGAVKNVPMPSFHGSSGECDDGAIFGPCLDIGLPAGALSAGEKIIRLFLPPLIGACFFQPDGNSPVENAALPPLPEISFRAAAIANMSLSPLQVSAAAIPGSGSFKWKIGKLCWLPPVLKKVNKTC